MRVRPIRSARRSRTQLVVAAIIPALIVTLSISGFVWAQKRVTVVIDGKSAQVKSQATTVGDLLSESSVRYSRGDVVSPGLDSDVTSGMTIVVRHAIPVTLDLGGDKVRARVVGRTVADALVAVGTDPSANTAVTPSLDTELRPNMTITAPEVFVRVTKEQVSVPYTTETRKDPSLPKGRREVVAAGAAGSAVRVYRVVVTDGVASAPQLAAETVVAEPVNRVVAVGTSNRVARASVDGSGSKLTTGRRLRFVTTGYAAGSGGADHVTATGRRAVHGVIAVDPRVIPLGTRVYIPGYGRAIAADTGGAIKGRRIDLCFDSYGEAISWGRRPVTVIILD